MNETHATISMRELHLGSTTKRILAGQRLTLSLGAKPIAEIVPLSPRSSATLDAILAPVKAAAAKAKPGKNLILEITSRPSYSLLGGDWPAQRGSTRQPPCARLWLTG